MDFFGNFILNLCVGFRIFIDDFGKEFDIGKYFFVNLFYI